LLTKFVLMLSILALPAAASAGGYIGLSVGQSSIDSSDFSDFDKDTSFSITGGYKFNQYFAMEASYIKLGDFEDGIAPVWTIEVDGINFAAVGIIPVNERFDIFGKVGVFVWEANLKEAGFGKLSSEDGSDISIGLGASANLTDQFDLIVEYQKFDLDGDKISNISIGGRYNF